MPVYPFPDDLRSKLLGETALLGKEDIQLIFPQDKHALVASWARLDQQGVTFILERCDFGPYLDGHEFAFPGHWMIEMAAQAGGLGAVALFFRREAEELYKFPYVVLEDEGRWLDKRFMASLESDKSLCVFVPWAGIVLDKPRYVVKEAVFSQCGFTATRTEITGRFCKRDPAVTLDKLIKRQSE